MNRAQAPHSPSSATYSPPSLPEYLSRNHALNVIVGVPTDEEVRAIHDTIRAVNSVSNFPALYDHKLSTQLAQHLFTVQMVSFQGRIHIHPRSSHYHVYILGTGYWGPSDEELESAYGVVRAMENLANSPFFDPVLGVKLSQHLFNIQFARYVQDANQGQFTQSQIQGRPSPPVDEVDIPAVTISNSVSHQETLNPTHTEPESATPSLAENATHVQPRSRPGVESQSNDKLDKLCAYQQETNRLLSSNEELLRVIKLTLISGNSNTNVRFNRVGSYTSYQTMNEKGEFPWMYHLQSTSGGSSGELYNPVVGKELVAYLKFYNIGTELIEEGTENLKPNKEADAKKALGSPTNCNTYTPPPIPEYLSRSHFKYDCGSTTDEEVEAIHNAIRALNIVSAVPTLYDSKLSTQLSQHLFTVQMAVHRNKYPSSIFPGENTYDPPSIPSHLPIRLEPVIGAPSDEEIELAHNAVRTLENLAIMHQLRGIKAESFGLFNSPRVENVIGHLEFYNIGAELIDEESGELKPGRKGDVEKLLSHRLRYGYPPIS
ncbi:laminin domain protein [Rhizoctonia solani]|uniref:Laminin domain protein n=2 Tax=Rhizoctonia solani TaxID=456999 RepID=A0A8H8P3X7_9AGAM|nr:laminin domain protein [Rhizoctonia solani]QRW24015.1 laminin domain protein [Rhizoctonia solani]